METESGAPCSPHTMRANTHAALLGAPLYETTLARYSFQNKAPLAAIMTRRASWSNAPTAFVSNPFCPSTFRTNCPTLLVPARLSASVDWVSLPEAPPQQKRQYQKRHNTHQSFMCQRMLFARAGPPRHECNLGSTSASSETTAATDARAA